MRDSTVLTQSSWTLTQALMPSLEGSRGLLLTPQGGNTYIICWPLSWQAKELAETQDGRRKPPQLSWGRTSWYMQFGFWGEAHGHPSACLENSNLSLGWGGSPHPLCAQPGPWGTASPGQCSGYWIRTRSTLTPASSGNSWGGKMGWLLEPSLLFPKLSP